MKTQPIFKILLGILCIGMAQQLKAQCYDQDYPCILSSHAWTMEGITGFREQKRFMDSKNFISIDGNHLGIQEYYFSDTPDTVFDRKKLGTTKGEYMVTMFFEPGSTEKLPVNY